MSPCPSRYEMNAMWDHEKKKDPLGLFYYQICKNFLESWNNFKHIREAWLVKLLVMVLCKTSTITK